MEKKRCVDCQIFSKITAMTNHVRKTSYCIIGNKTVYAHNAKSIACDKFIQRKEN